MCEYCDGLNNKPLYIDDWFSDMDGTKLTIQRDKVIALCYYEGLHGHYYFNIRFCPMCGRRLFNIIEDAKKNHKFYSATREDKERMLSEFFEGMEEFHFTEEDLDQFLEWRKLV